MIDPEKKKNEKEKHMTMNSLGFEDSERELIIKKKPKSIIVTDLCLSSNTGKKNT